jgi:hypothetical protein
MDSVKPFKILVRVTVFTTTSEVPDKIKTRINESMLRNTTA